MYNHLTVRKQMSSGSFKNVIYKLCISQSDTYKEDFILDNLQCLIHYKPNQTKPNHLSIFFNSFPYFA